MGGLCNRSGETTGESHKVPALCIFVFKTSFFFFFGFLLMFYQLPEVYTAQGGRKRTIKDYEDPKWKQGYDPNAVAIEVINLETVKRMHIT
jgi:hypothetical protein